MLQCSAVQFTKRVHSAFESENNRRAVREKRKIKFSKK